MRILIVEDEPTLGNLLKANLEAESYAVDLKRDSETALRAMRTNAYDVILLDDILPDGRGFELCQKFRQTGAVTPILFMSVQVGVDRRVESLDAGADDYLPKPFAYAELSARLRAILRRPRELQREEIWNVGCLTLNVTASSVTRAGEFIYLTPKEFALLCYLMRNAGKLVTRAMIFEHVWSEEANPFSNMIETHVHNLRQKLDRPDAESVIKTLSGRGYIMAS